MGLRSLSFAGSLWCLPLSGMLSMGRVIWDGELLDGHLEEDD